MKAGLQPGYVKIFTNLCIFEKNKKTGLLEVISIHKGVSKREIVQNTSSNAVNLRKSCPTNDM